MNEKDKTVEITAGSSNKNILLYFFASEPKKWEEVLPPTTENPGSSEMNPENNKEPEGIQKKPKSSKEDSGYPLHSGKTDY